MMVIGISFWGGAIMMAMLVLVFEALIPSWFKYKKAGIPFLGSIPNLKENREMLLFTMHSYLKTAHHQKGNTIMYTGNVYGTKLPASLVG